MKKKISKRGQYEHAGSVTLVPTSNGKITMRDVPYPVFGVDEFGIGKIMMPGEEHQFKGKNILEIPMMNLGGATYPNKEYMKSFPIGATLMFQDGGQTNLGFNDPKYLYRNSNSEFQQGLKGVAAATNPYINPYMHAIPNKGAFGALKSIIGGASALSASALGYSKLFNGKRDKPTNQPTNPEDITNPYTVPYMNQIQIGPELMNEPTQPSNIQPGGFNLPPSDLWEFQGGGQTPIYVTDPTDPRLIGYNDSLSAFRNWEKIDKLDEGKPDYTHENVDLLKDNYNSRFKPSGTAPYSVEFNNGIELGYYRYKKPTQPVKLTTKMATPSIKSKDLSIKTPEVSAPIPVVKPYIRKDISWKEWNEYNKANPSKRVTTFDEFKKKVSEGSINYQAGGPISPVRNPTQDNPYFAPGYNTPTPDFQSFMQQNIKKQFVQNDPVRNQSTNPYGLPADQPIQEDLSAEQQAQQRQRSIGYLGDPEGMLAAYGALGAMGGINDYLGYTQNEKRYKDKLRDLGNTDNMFANEYAGLNPFGNYTVNAGQGQNFQPNKTLYAQDFGKSMSMMKKGGEYQEGGEYDLTEEEIQEILRNGGEIEYI